MLKKLLRGLEMCNQVKVLVPNLMILVQFLGHIW